MKTFKQTSPNICHFCGAKFNDHNLFRQHSYGGECQIQQPAMKKHVEQIYVDQLAKFEAPIVTLTETALDREFRLLRETCAQLQQTLTEIRATIPANQPKKVIPAHKVMHQQRALPAKFANGLVA